MYYYEACIKYSRIKRIQKIYITALLNKIKFKKHL